ncbi:MAG: folate-binding protein YgfZ [Acidimicrobiales bacterium]|nr:folate-binding protein YgfZ [Acidimicrobiales bacterium]
MSDDRDLMADEQALRGSVGAVRTDREVIEVAGPDAATFLQGQLSQDVAGLAEGASAWTFVLHPDGKVAVWGRITRLGPDRFVFDVDAGAGAALVARLERFKLRVDATIAPLDWQVVALRGPDAPSVDVGDAVTADPEWPSAHGVDLLGPAPTVPEGVRWCAPEVLEVLRIESGVPAMGAELDEHTIPAESGVVERSVSFTKGCFTGQELTARIDSRGGNVPRHLRGLLIAGSVPPVGAEVLVDDEVVGAITSAAPGAAGHGGGVALAYVKRSVDPPAAATVRWGEGEARGEVRPLPLLPLAG